MSKWKIGQYFNFDGIKLMRKYLFQKIKPDMQVNRLLDIDTNELINQRIKFIVLDKDNTLTLPYQNDFADEQVQSGVTNLISTFGKNNVAILSNSAGSKDDPEYKEAKELEARLRLKVIRHITRKPMVKEEILESFNTTNPREVCVIGDRLYVDVIMGKECGCYTILVEPISYSLDNFIVRLVRKYERIVLKYM